LTQIRRAPVHSFARSARLQVSVSAEEDGKANDRAPCRLCSCRNALALRPAKSVKSSRNFEEHTRMTTTQQRLQAHKSVGTKPCFWGVPKKTDASPPRRLGGRLPLLQCARFSAGRPSREPVEQKLRRLPHLCRDSMRPSAAQSLS
jgi:hypothetical protein